MTRRLLPLAAILTLTACGNPPVDHTINAGPQPTTTTRPTPAPAADPTAGVSDAMWRATSTTQRASRNRPRATVTTSAPAQAVSGDVLACIRRYESGGNYQAVSPAGHRGAYQFSQSTWRGAVTRAGYPEYAGTLANEAPAHVQDAAARQLLSERGLQPWPTPARRCA